MTNPDASTRRVRRTRYRIAAAIVVAVAIVATLVGLRAATAGGLPDDVVARVEGHRDITRDDYTLKERFQLIDASRRLGQPERWDPSKPTILPFLESRAACVSALRAGIPADVADAYGDSGLGDLCRVTAARIRRYSTDATLSAAVNAIEARRLGIRVTDAEIQAQTEYFLGRIGGAKNLPGFTERTGIGLDEIRVAAREAFEVGKLEKKIKTSSPKVTERDIEAEYRDRPERYKTLEYRDVHLLRTRTKAQADAARQEIAAGESFARVARRRSDDPSTKARGGRLRKQGKLSLPKDVRGTVFDAPVGALSGPVKTDGGYYLFRVDRIRPPKQLPFAAARPQIEGNLTVDKPQRAWSAWLVAATKRWQQRIECQDGYDVVELCGNQAADADERIKSVPPAKPITTNTVPTPAAGPE